VVLIIFLKVPLILLILKGLAELKKYDTIFLDRDGTLNPDSGYISKLADFNFYNFTIPALIKLSQIGNRFCIITNQSGVKRGLIEQKSLNDIHLFVTRTFADNNIPLLGIYVSTSLPNAASKRRKPGTGMFIEASLKHKINLKKSLMIGDSIGDMEAGKKLEMETLLVLTGLGEKSLESMPSIFMPTFIEENLFSFACQMIERD